MSQSRPYSKGLHDIINHIASSHSEFHHPFMEEREVKNVGFIVVSTDRGLCGGLNINLFRKIALKMQEFSKQNVGIKVVLLGTKASGYFNHSNIDVMAQQAGFGDDPKPEKLVGAIKVMTDAFLKGEVDAIYLACNSFKILWFRSQLYLSCYHLFAAMMKQVNITGITCMSLNQNQS